MKKVHLERPVASLKMRLLAPIKGGNRNRIAISRLPIQEQILLVDTVQTDDGKLVYVKNSKAACTTITKELFKYSKGYEYEGKIHRRKKDFRQGIKHHAVNRVALFRPDAFKFAFVRNPQSRAISAFIDFFVMKRNPFSFPHAEPIAKFGFDENSSIGAKFDVYLDYISASFTIDAYRTDRHFRRQTLNIGLDIINYNFVGKIEFLDRDLDHVFSEVGAHGFIDISQSIQAHNRSEKTSFTLSKTQKLKIEVLYEKDFEAFGYS